MCWGTSYSNWQSLISNVENHPTKLDTTWSSEAYLPIQRTELRSRLESARPKSKCLLFFAAPEYEALNWIWRPGSAQNSIEDFLRNWIDECSDILSLCREFQEICFSWDLSPALGKFLHSTTRVYGSAKTEKVQRFLETYLEFMLLDRITAQENVDDLYNELLSRSHTLKGQPDFRSARERRDAAKNTLGQAELLDIVSALQELTDLLEQRTDELTLQTKLYDQLIEEFESQEQNAANAETVAPMLTSAATLELARMARLRNTTL